MKKVLVIGSSGLLGSAIVNALSKNYEVIEASKSSSLNPVDISNPQDLKELFKKIGKVDSMICTAGQVRFNGLTQATDDDWQHGLSNKLMGQINVVRFGTESMNHGGSILLTTGILSQYPMPGSSIVTAVNAGVEGFVKAAALELKGKIRVNAISPGWVTETLEKMKMDTTPGTPASEVALAYLTLMNSNLTGEIKVVAKG